MNRPNGCPINCPGCRYIDLPYYETLNRKYEFLKKLLVRWQDNIFPIRFSEKNKLGYRKKVILNVKNNSSSWIFGMVVKNDIIDISDCPIHDDLINRSINLFKRTLPAYELFPLHFYLQYDKQIALILKSKQTFDISWLNNFKKEFEELGIEGIWVHYNPSAGKRIFEKTPLKLVYGREISKNDLEIFYSIGAFQQLIQELYYDSLMEAKKFYINDNDDEINIIDLYSGSGSSLKMWVSFAKVIGVELNGMSYKIAKLNAPSALILRGKCSERLPQINSWIENNVNKRINLFVNPPRTGLEKEIIDWILLNKIPFKIAYLSCSPGTLKRDLKKLSEAYEVCKIIPYDFFPFTHHIETLALLKKL